MCSFLLIVKNDQQNTKISLNFHGKYKQFHSTRHTGHTAQDRLLVFHVKNLLESYNIHCIVKNEFLMGAAGELPPHECWPELWIEDNKKYDKALEILEKNWIVEEMTQPNWTCTRCGETLEGQFTACWRCGESRYR